MDRTLMPILEPDAAVPVINFIRLAPAAESDDPLRDGGFLQNNLMAVVLFRPWAALEAEILLLRQQIIVMRRGKPGRLSFSTLIEWSWVGSVTYVLQPVVRSPSFDPTPWCGGIAQAFRLFWHWKSRRLRNIRPGAWLISPYTGWKWAKWPSGDVGWVPPNVELPKGLQVPSLNYIQ